MGRPAAAGRWPSELSQNQMVAIILVAPPRFHIQLSHGLLPGVQLPHVDVDLDLELAVADVAMGLIWLGHGDEPGRTEGANMFGPESVEGLTSSSISHPNTLVPIPSSPYPGA